MNFIFLFSFVLILDHINSIDNQPVFAKQTTQLLDRLLLNYNKYSRPNPLNETTKVHMSLQIKNIVHNRNEMMFTLQCVLNQWWIDSRLSYWNYFVEKKNQTYLPFDLLELTHKLATIKLPSHFQIWLPDTFILNGRPTMSGSNLDKRLIRLHLDGTVLLSTRIMFQFKCRMDWSSFPHDVQRCPLYIASFSYTDKEIAYRWINKNPCSLSPKLGLSQLNVIKLSCVNKTRKLSQIWIDTKKYRSTISLDLYFKRNTEIYLIAVYLPCIVLVMTSYMSFFINREATNVRVMISSMTFLSMIILSIENRLLVKNVPYYTAIDYFVTISFLFILATILEYIFVHSNTKIAYGDIGTFSNWIPIDRIAKLFYSALQPKEQILKRTSPTPLSKDEQLAAIVRLNKEPMIYDLPITDNLKDDQAVLMNNLLLNNQISLINHSNTLSLRRSTATSDLIDQLANNYSTFPRVNHHHQQSSSSIYQIDDSFNLTAQLDDSLIGLNSNGSLMDANSLGSNMTKTLKRKLSSIPEETFIQNAFKNSNQIEEEIENEQLNDNLKYLRQQQEEQLERQQNYQLDQLRNAVFELERTQNLAECETILDNLNNENEDSNKKDNNRKGNQIGIGNKLGYRLNAKINAKRLNTNNIIGRIYYEFLSSLLSCYNPKSNNQNDSINQLNSISRIDQVCRLMFPVLYLLFILSYYLLFVI